MNKKTYFQTTLVVFIIVAVVHSLRILLGWPAEISGWEVPMWVSWLAVIVAGTLAYHAYKINKRS